MLQRRRTSQNLIIGTAAGAAALLLAAAPAAVAEEPAADPAFTGTVSIVHINDVHSNVFEGEPGIGYGRAAAYAAQVRAENPDTLFLDAGDVFAGNPYSAIDEGAGLVPVLNTLDLDAMTVGNAEFTYGSSVLEERLGALNYPALGGNMIYRADRRPIAPTTTTVDLPNGMTVGIVGVTTPSSALMGADDLAYVDAIEVARQGVAELRAADVDLLVGLVHLGELDAEMSSPKLAEAIPDFDVIIDGHSHTAFPEGLVVNGTLIAQAGGFSEYIGRVDLDLVDGGVTGVEAQLSGLEDLAGLAPKPDTQQALDQMRQSADEQFAEVVGSTLVPLDGNRSLVRTGEAAVANMFADAVREATEADLAFLSAGYVGGQIEPGDITRRQLFEIARVDTSIITKRMTGQQILDYIERCVREYPRESGEFIHVGGGGYSIDVEAERRVHSVTVDGEPIGLDTSYLVALPKGGGEFPGAIDAETVADHGSATPMLEAYLRAHSPVSPELEGRIAFAPTPGPGDSDAGADSGAEGSDAGGGPESDSDAGAGSPDGSAPGDADASGQATAGSEAAADSGAGAGAGSDADADSRESGGASDGPAPSAKGDSEVGLASTGSEGSGVVLGLAGIAVLVGGAVLGLRARAVRR
ncbi:bifunctional metallophosphatase/5'-nucleotidase [Leucobacter tenebrionis]|uniref:bifunctional metallophosphatase/5'-nucleotidase n=1 Tax=Leucobacter tenebrionis TaxID=2873270 RepID=UPI001CA5F67D|nr:bifunctional UDP-sugar hydrolase/5'-nucleotidase [Leucobacter tenebrionis]QZY51665.1 5'-nucleotidase C-terminal domain-containing protein [Leucobacter tenebrionis]